MGNAPRMADGNAPSKKVAQYAVVSYLVAEASVGPTTSGIRWENYQFPVYFFGARDSDKTISRAWNALDDGFSQERRKLPSRE